jgi:small-conductance mechanosensitive channel
MNSEIRRENKLNSPAAGILCLALLIIPAVSLSQNTEMDSISVLKKAPVIIDGRVVYSVRGVSDFPAEERAKQIKERIINAAGDTSLLADSVKSIYGITRDDIVIGKFFLAGVFDADSDLEGIDRHILTDIIKQKITRAINSYRHERKFDVVLNRTLQAIGVTLLVLLLLRLISWILKRINSRLQEKLKTSLESIEVHSFKIIKVNQLWMVLYGLIRTLKILIVIVIVFIYFEYILSLYPWSRYISFELLDFFIAPLLSLATALVNFIPNLAFLLVLIFIIRGVLKLFKILFNGLSRGVITVSGFEPDWAIPTYNILRILLLAFAVIIAYPYIPGSDSDAFKGISIFIGVLFSLGSPSFIGNLIAGYTMIYRKTFKMGDVVAIGEYFGKVLETSLFVTRLRTPFNEEVVVPNSVILSSNITNYTSLAGKTGTLIHTSVGIGYETPWRQVESMLRLAAGRTDGILKDPQPIILHSALNDFAVLYKLYVYTNEPLQKFGLISALNRNILDVFNENKVQIMTPAYRSDPERPKIVPEDQWFTPVIDKSGEKSKK